MTWKPDFDPLAETSRAKLWVRGLTQVAVQAIQRPGETADDVVSRLLLLHDQVKQISVRKLTSRQAARRLERLRATIQ